MNISRVQENQVNQSRYLGERGEWKKGRMAQILPIDPCDLCDCHGTLVSSGKPIYEQCVSVTEPFPYQCRELFSSTMLMLMKISFCFLISFPQYINHEMGPFFSTTSLCPTSVYNTFPLCIFSCIAAYLQESEVLW